MSRNVPLIAGNWKMYKTASEAADFIEKIGSTADKTICKVYIAPSFTSIEAAAIAAKGKKVIIGAQNMSDKDEGAFTGEVSAKMLKEAGARFVILGHSERRHIFLEDNAYIQSKLKTALSKQLQPILCVGETREERDGGKTEQVLRKQLSEALEGFNEQQLPSLVIAYEPVWAIGTGLTATPEMADEAHRFCRKVLEILYNESFSKDIPILYGGSVKPENTKDLLSKADIDGALIGGASLKVDSFKQIIQEAERTKA